MAVPDRRTLDELKIDRASALHSSGRGWILLAIAALVAAAAGAGWWFRHSKTPLVQTAAAQSSAEGGQNILLNGSGYVTARRAATVSSKVTGKVVEVLVEEGMKVTEGQILAKLDPSNVEASLRLAQAQLEASRKGLDEIKANLDQAEREFRRATQLASHQVASQSELDRAEADAKSLRARLARQQADVSVAEKELALWQQQLDDTIIRAPFSGVVTSKNAQPGEMISPMSAGGSFTRTGICTLVDMSSLEVEVDVNENYINRVTPKQPVEATLDSYPDWHIPAKVIAIIPTADRQKATVKVRVGFDQLDPRILPDMGVKVAFQSNQAAAAAPRQIRIPKAAVHQRDGRDMVWIVHGGRVERRAIVTGAARGDDMIVSAGLNPGEHVVISSANNLADGDRVKEATP